MSDAAELVQVRCEAPLGWVIINRPAARNALNAAMWQALAAAVRTLAADEATRVIILTGAGDRAFIAGADIAELKAQAEGDAVSEASIRAALAGLRAITEAPQPVIAMINGACFGGGVLIAVTCDLRFAGASAQFGIPAVKLGVAYPMEEGVVRLVNTIGPANAADVLLSGRTFAASEAWQMGLINRVLAEGELATFTRDYALKLAEGAPLAIKAHKLALQQAVRAEAERATNLVEAAWRACYASADHREGLQAFLEKRQPRFKGC